MSQQGWQQTLTLAQPLGTSLSPQGAEHRLSVCLQVSPAGKLLLPKPQKGLSGLARRVWEVHRWPGFPRGHL